MRAYAFVIISIGLLAGCATTSFGEQPSGSPQRSTSQAARADAMPGELLVKLTPEAAQAVERATAKGTIQQTGIESLDTLFVRYGVSRVERVFPDALSPEELKRRFPDRAKRAEESSAPPDLTTIYKVKFAPGFDVLEAATAFSKDSSVVYAEPNRIVHALPTSEEAPQ